MSKRNLLIQQTTRNYEGHKDFFPTPGWATRALFEYVVKPTGTVLEPASGHGHMTRVLQEYGMEVTERDLMHGDDYMKDDREENFDWIITNPPFTLGKEFVIKSLSKGDNVAMFVRQNFLEGQRRYAELFSKYPPSKIAIFTQRVGLKYGKVVDMSSAVGYVWIVWEKGITNTEFIWIPPCKVELAKPEDYDE